MSEIATVMNRKAEAVPPKIASAFVFFHFSQCVMHQTPASQPAGIARATEMGETINLWSGL
jgi:hypothetical protein